MTIAFLFLTYDNITHADVIKEYTKKDNIYLHPKYPQNVNQYFKKYIISNLVETEWGKYSIVEATLNLLEAAFQKEENDWFILLSQDIYPLFNYIKLKKLLDKQNSSLFDLKYKRDNYWKTAQWWILNRQDVEIILKNKSYKSKFQKNFGYAAIDELYFLTVLKWNNPKYYFTNMKVMYDKWLKNVVQKSPSTFNHLIKNDFDYIKENNCLFIRKVTPIFNLVEYKPKKKLYVIYIGTETKQDIPENDSFDIIILTSLKLNKIKENIRNRAIYIHHIIHSTFFDCILSIAKDPFIKFWSIVIFTTETFNLNNYNSIEKKRSSLPGNIKNNIEQFYYIKDNNNQLAFFLIHNK
jgi:hypothetical protein